MATSVGQWFAQSPGYLDSIIKKIDETFAAARAVAPAIIFLDELDAVPSRAKISPRGADWWLPVITHLLTTLDGAMSGKTEKLVLVAATNHGDRIDSALTRPGRFGSIINIGVPDAPAMAGILRQHLGPDLAESDLSGVAERAAGGTGAMAVAWVRAARRRARLDKRPLLLSDLEHVISPPDRRSQELVRRIALHEAGHAVAAHVINFGRVKLVSIVEGNGRGGFTEIEHDGTASTREEVEQMVIQLLSGRAAEEICLAASAPGTGSGGGPHSDLAMATRAIGQLHLSNGLGSSLRYRATPDEVPSILAADPEVSTEIEAELQRLYSQALELIIANRGRVSVAAERIGLSKAQVERLVRRNLVPHIKAGYRGTTVLIHPDHLRLFAGQLAGTMQESDFATLMRVSPGCLPPPRTPGAC